MHRIHWSTVFWGLFWLCVVIYVVKNPAQAAGQIRSVVDATVTFVGTLAGS